LYSIYNYVTPNLFKYNKTKAESDCLYQTIYSISYFIGSALLIVKEKKKVENLKFLILFSGLGVCVLGLSVIFL
jgi:hypothetical protein